MQTLKMESFLSYPSICPQDSLRFLRSTYFLTSPGLISDVMSEGTGMKVMSEGTGMKGVKQGERDERCEGRGQG